MPKTVFVSSLLFSLLLIPVFAEAGGHAINDMAGDEEASWKSILTKAGIRSEIVLKGTAEYDNMVAIWVSYLRDAMGRL